MTHHPITAWTVVVGFFSHQGHELPTSTVGSLAFSEVHFGKFSFVILQPFIFKHLLNINLVNSQFVGIFCQADSIIVHCRIDKRKLLPLPLGEIHCRPSACKLFFCGPSVLQVLNSLVNCGFGHSQLLEGFDRGNCAKRVIRKSRLMTSSMVFKLSHSVTVAVNCKDRL